jgi:hypothetical protein
MRGDADLLGRLPAGSYEGQRAMHKHVSPLENVLICLIFR